jgi:hypothetical protein
MVASYSLHSFNIYGLLGKPNRFLFHDHLAAAEHVRPAGKRF